MSPQHIATAQHTDPKRLRNRGAVSEPSGAAQAHGGLRHTAAHGFLYLHLSTPELGAAAALQLVRSVLSFPLVPVSHAAPLLTGGLVLKAVKTRLRPSGAPDEENHQHLMVQSRFSRV